MSSFKPEPLLCSSCYSTVENLPLQGFDLLSIRSANLTAKARSNHLPNAVEKSRLTFLSDVASQSLPYCDYKILQIERILKDLLKQRSEIVHFIDQSHSLRAPIRKLPPEILNEIFLLVWKAEMGITVKRKKASGATFRLSWVCSFWRDIIRSQGIFWSSFDIDLRCIGSALLGFKATSSLIRSIARSGAAPMSLCLNFGSMSYVLPEQSELMTALNKSSKKWKDLRLDFTGLLYSHFPEHLLRQGPLDLSSLETLTIVLEPWRSTGQSFPFLHQTPYPRLRHLCTNVLRATDKLDLRNITTLDIEEYRGTSFAQLLSYCPSLETLQLHGFHSTVNPDDITQDPPLRHSRLSELKLAFDGRFDRDAWQSLSLPNLTSLSLFYDMRNFNRINEIRMMLMLSKSPLESLSLYDFPEHTVIELIKDVPSLSRLYLSRDVLSATLFNKLVITPNQPHIAPSLTALSFEMDGTWSSGLMFESPDEFLEACCGMAASRSKVGLARARASTTSQGSGDKALVPLQEFSLRLPYAPEDVISTLLCRMKDVAPELNVMFN